MSIDKDKLYSKYIVENKSRRECASIFECSESCIAKYLRLYNIKKDRSKILENTTKSLMNKYGVTNPALLETNKFKVDNPSKNKEILSRRAETYKRKYEEDKSIKEKRIKTNIERFGTKTFAESKLFAEFMRNKASQRDNCVREKAISVPYWHDLILKEIGIDLKFEGKIFGDRRSCDLYDEERRIGIDINPTASHNTQFNVYTRKYAHTISTTYHRTRALDAEKNGWQLYQIFDWDDQAKVLQQLKSLFGKNKRLYARECKVAEVDKEACDTFLETYHLQGKVGAQYRYGLFYKGELVSVMTFGATRFTKDADIELLRYCSKDTVVGGASKLFKYAIEHINCNSIMTYSDIAKGTGNLYSKLGFKFVKYANLNAYYAPISPTGQALRTQAASLEYKKNGQGYNSCREYFNAKGWYRINDAGNKIWLWQRDVAN